MTSSTTPAPAASNGGPTEATLEIPGYVTMITPAAKRDMRSLISYTAELFAAHPDLPAPVYVSVSQSAQDICMQFPDDPGSFRVLALWAERFGGTVTGYPHTDSDQRECVHCQVKFTHDSVAVDAYAFIHATKATPTA